MSRKKLCQTYSAITFFLFSYKFSGADLFNLARGNISKYKVNYQEYKDRLHEEPEIEVQDYVRYSEHSKY